MKSIHISMVLLTIIALSCKSKKKFNVDDEKAKEMIVDEHNSMNALDWNGTYQATLPSADCDGIQTVLVLNNDLTYTQQSKHLGENDTISKTEGKFVWAESGQVITLDNEKSKQYFVGENRLWKLDADGNKIAGDLAQNYIFNKQQTQLTDRHWKLVELNGQKIDNNKKKGNQPYLMLRPDEDNKVYGNAGCNRFFGTFELKEGGQLTFSQLGATKMYCQAMKTEKQLLEVLSKVDNYSLDGETMTLNKAKMAPLAKFEVAYFY